MTNPLIIIADTYQLACFYAKEHDLGPERARGWRYVTEMRQVLGLQGPGEYVWIMLPQRLGTTGGLTERLAIAQHLRLAGFTEKRWQVAP